MANAYYAENLLTEVAQLRARVAQLEKALPAARVTGLGGRAAMMAMAMSGDTPTPALPPAGEIAPVYFVEEESRDVYRGLVRWVNGKPRYYVQRVGRSREQGE